LTRTIILALGYVVATTDWRKAGNALQDITRYINVKVVNLYSRLKPTPSGEWPPTSQDLGIGDPGDPAQWPKLPNPKNWLPFTIPILMHVVEKILEPFLPKKEGDPFKLKDEEIKQGPKKLNSPGNKLKAFPEPRGLA